MADVPLEDDDTLDYVPPSLTLWRVLGFSDAEASSWLAVEPRGRFTPYTARAWTDEGFGPADAALWSEVFADPVLARTHRSKGFTDPFPEPGYAL